jgi:hypothetical protein
MTAHPKHWLAHLACTHATPTSVAATVGRWVSCGTCHDQRRITSVSYVLNALPVVQGELWTVEELSELEEAA